MASTPRIVNPFGTNNSFPNTQGIQASISPFKPSGKTENLPIQNTSTIPPPNTTSILLGTANKQISTNLKTSKPLQIPFKNNQEDFSFRNHHVSSGISNEIIDRKFFEINPLDLKEIDVLKKRSISDVMQENKNVVKKHLDMFDNIIKETIEIENSNYAVLRNFILIQFSFDEIQKKRKEIEGETEIMITEQASLGKILDDMSTGLDNIIASSGYNMHFESKDSIYHVGSPFSNLIDLADKDLNDFVRTINEKFETTDSANCVDKTINNFLECLRWTESQIEKNNEKLIKLEEACRYIL